MPPRLVLNAYWHGWQQGWVVVFQYQLLRVLENIWLFPGNQEQAGTVTLRANVIES